MHIQERLGRTLQERGVRGDFDVCHAVDGDVDELIGGHGFAGFDIHLHDAQGELIDPREERQAPPGFTDENAPAVGSGDDIRGVRRSFEVAGDEQQHHEHCHGKNCDYDRSH